MIYDASYDIFDFKTIGCIIRMCELYEIQSDCCHAQKTTAMALSV